MMWEKGGNDQEMQSKVGAHYRLPMVSFRDAIWPEIEAGRLKWSDYIVDTVHPTDAGHVAAASFITAMCDTALNAARTVKPARHPLPAPLYTDAFQHVGWRDAATLDPIDNEGWSRGFNETNMAGWDGPSTAGRISFDWTGSGVVAVFAEPPGDLHGSICIDGGISQTLDVLKQPKRQLFVLARNLAPGRHTVELASLHHEDGGKPVRLLGIAASARHRISAARHRQRRPAPTSIENARCNAGQKRRPKT